MSDGTCPTCGEPLVRKLSGRGAVVSAGHEVDGPACRLALWEREVARRGLVRVVGRAAAYLCDRRLVQYGPFWLTVEQEMRDAAQLGREGGVQPPFKSKAPCRVTSAFAPRWAYEVARAFGTVVGDALCRTTDELEFVRRDEGLQRAVEAAAMLAESVKDARKAVAAVVRSAMQEVKRGGGGGELGEKDGGGS